MNSISKQLTRQNCRKFGTRTIPSWNINVKGQSGSMSSMSLGVGVFHDEEASQSVVNAANLGVTFFDNAMMQGNQKAVGVGLKRTGLKREQF